jgi:hypothetical protein
MKTEILKLELDRTETVPCYGGTKTNAYYTLTTTCENMKNVYEIFAEIRGIATADLYLNIWGVTPLTNNENTLIPSAIEDLLGW